MKRALTLAILMTSAQVWAQDLRLGDLNFFQKEKSIYWNTELTNSSGEVDVQPSFNNSQQFDTERTLWSNTVLYGISDRLNAGLSFDYAVKNEFDSTQLTQGGNPNFTGRDYENNGLSDFTINVNYRLLSEKFYIDLISGLTLGLGESERGFGGPFSKKDGNFKQGHHSLLAGVAAGQKISDFEWRGTLAFDYHASGERKLYDSTGSDTFTTDSYLNWLLRAEGQYRFLTNFAVSVFIDYVMVGTREQSGDIQNISTDITYDPYSTLNYGIIGKYNVSDTLLVKAGATLLSGYEVDGETKSVFSGSVSGKTEFESSRELMVGAELLF